MSLATRELVPKLHGNYDMRGYHVQPHRVHASVCLLAFFLLGVPVAHQQLSDGNISMCRTLFYWQGRRAKLLPAGGIIILHL